MGQRVMGNILVMGPERDMGTHHHDGICGADAQGNDRQVWQSALLPYIYNMCIPVSADNLFRRELYTRWYAQLCLGNKWFLMFLTKRYKGMENKTIPFAFIQK